MAPKPFRFVSPRPGRILWILALAILFATPALAYNVILVDGSRIEAAGPPEIRDGRAIIELPNGTTTFIDADEIDQEATREANRDTGGSGLVIDRGRAGAGDAGARQEPTLSDLINRRDDVGTRPRRPAVRDDEPARTVTSSTPRTTAGFPDLSTLPRRPYERPEVATSLQRFFRSQGLDTVQLYRGTEPDRPLVEMTTGSEASVFRGIEVAAAALQAVRDEHPERVEALELYLSTPEGDRAGQFLLTPELAADLTEGWVEVADFYVAFVQF